MPKAIWWIRRDLRLRDNATLHVALKHGDVIPVFVRDPHLGGAISARRQSFLWDALKSLNADLRTKGSRLIFRSGTPESVLTQLLHETGATTIFAEEDYTPYARKRDEKVAQSLPLKLVQGQLVHHPLAALKADGTPYTVFTPFSKNWKALLPTTLDILGAPERMPAVSAEIRSEDIPPGEQNPLFPASEAAAQRRLLDFCSPSPEGRGVGVRAYAETRDRVDLDGTSSLSPYLHFGMLGLREAVHHVRQAIVHGRDETSRKGAETWLNELIWRAFYIHILFHFPHVRDGSFRPEYDRIEWVNDPAEFTYWKIGRTGYPIVDAAMRQLRETGWMHNRARMIVASFLVKDLLIDWRWGERWFMENLLDGDLAANNGGWQWTAGVGTDAAPYFRIFNPITQSQKFDPNGDYIRRWVPELAHLAAEDIHAPVGVKGYPPMIVDHKFARERTLDAYKQVKSSS